MQELNLATLVMSCSNAHHTLKLVQFASCEIDGKYTLALVSVAGPQTAVKSFAAALNENVRITVNVKDVETQAGPAGEKRDVSQYRDFVGAGGQGKYQCTMHRLPYNNIHCTARLKSERLLPVLNEQTLWQRLSSPVFTTPIVRSWIPWIMRRLIDDEQLEYLPAFQCSPGLLKLTDDQLDSIVSTGVGLRYLPIGKATPCNS